MSLDTTCCGIGLVRLLQAVDVTLDEFQVVGDLLQDGEAGQHQAVRAAQPSVLTPIRPVPLAALHGRHGQERCQITRSVQPQFSPSQAHIQPLTIKWMSASFRVQMESPEQVIRESCQAKFAFISGGLVSLMEAVSMLIHFTG